MPRPPTDRLIGTQIAHYRIDAVLGTGGMGTVYRAYDLKLERPVALKSVQPGRSQRGLDQFLEEVRTVSNLNDPNIVTIHGFEHCDEGRFIVMEFVEGVTLRAFVGGPNSRARMPVEEIVKIAMQIASALRVAHAAGIIHRDIKPENVMVRQHDRLVKLLDFGLARLMPRATARADAGGRAGGARHRLGATSTRTRRAPVAALTNKWGGTLRYMSPEQIHGRRLSGATDIFSLGVVLYELLTGTHPFGGRDYVGTLAQILERNPKPLRSVNPDVPEPLGRLVLSMIAKLPAARPDAEAVMARLSQVGRRPMAQPGRPHIVGRQKQLESAVEHLESFPRCVLLSVLGEAGAGKTTLVEEFLSHVAPAHADQDRVPFITLQGRCEKLLAGAEAYLPVLEVLHTLLRTDSDGSAAAVLKERAPGWYLQVTSTAPEAVMTDVRAASPQRMNREFFDFLSALRGDRSIVLFLDDVHWADMSTVYLLDYLISRADSLRLFTVVTARPEALDDSHPFVAVIRKFAGQDRAQEIALDLLSSDDVLQYIDLEFPRHRFPRRFIRLIHKRTEGNPLFMVDLLRDLRTRGVLTQRQSSWVVGSVSDVTLPKRIESLIDQKIVALDDEDRALLSWAAVQGYEFDSAVLARASDSKETKVEERLNVLERRHALVRRIDNEELPTGTVTVKYRFTHVLYQNALEDRVRRTPSRHAELSLAVANALVAVYGPHRKAVASLLARLFEAARELSLSSEYFQIAAENAAQISAHSEASTLLTRGLELLQKLPSGTARDERELAMQLALGASLMALNGFAADGVRDAYARAKQLCDTLGNPEPQIQMVLRGLWGYHLVRAEYVAARELAHSLHSLAKRANNHALLVEGNHALAFTLCHMGELTNAVNYRREAIRLHAEQPGMDYGFPFALDPGVGCSVEYAMDLWLLGYPDQARAEGQRACDLGERLGHPYSHGFALMFAAGIHEFCGEIALARERAEQGIKLAKEHGLKEVQGWSMLRRGWAQAMSGDPKEVIAGIALQQTVLDTQLQMGSKIARPHFLGCLAQSLLEAGRPSEAVKKVEEALKTVQETGARYYYAELLRLRGVCAVALGESSAVAEDLFWQAREVAHAQEAKSFELRAVVSLARLLATSEKSNEGRAQLDEVYGWFREGFDTEDLREARELLAGLR